jgi:hypothetical protein
VSTNWRRPLTQAAVLLMESLWGYALVAFFVSLTVRGDRPTLFGAGAVVFASFAVSRLLQATTMSLGLLRAWGVGLSLLLFYAIVRVDFFGDLRLWDFTWADDLINHTEASLRDEATAVLGVPALWLLWMRGVLRGQQSLIFDEVVNSFAVGVVIIAIVELFAGAVDAPAAVGYVAVPYVAVGLMTIGFAHASRSEKDFGRSFTSTWVVAVAGAVSLITLLALLFVIVDFETARAAAGDVSLAIVTAVVRSLAFLAWPLEQFFYGLFKLMTWLVNLYGGERPERPAETPAEGMQEEEETDRGGAPVWIKFLARLLIGGSLAAVVLFTLAMLFFRYARRPAGDEVKESTYQEGRLASDLGDMLGSLLGRLRPSLHSNRDGVDAMRRLYYEMLAAGEERGVQRRKAETPLELAPRLGRTFDVGVTERVTVKFDETHYGGHQPADADVRTLRDEWERTRRA